MLATRNNRLNKELSDFNERVKKVLLTYSHFYWVRIKVLK